MILEKFFPCDHPMYAVKSEKGLFVAVRWIDKASDFGGYFYIDENLEKYTLMRSTQGVCPCHLCEVNGSGYIVNYLSGNVVRDGVQTVTRIGRSVNETRQSEPHTHFVGKTADGNLAVADLGTDTLAVYDTNLNLLCESKVPSGYGIRHLAFSPKGEFVYAINELVPSVSIFRYEKGRAELVDTVKIPCKNPKANGAAIRISDDGKKLYLSLREENELLCFAAEGSRLTLLQRIDCGGDSPRDFQIFGKFLICCNEKSGNATVFQTEEGLLTKITDETESVGVLCCV